MSRAQQFGLPRLLLLILMCLLAPMASGAVWHVSPMGDPLADGSGWQAATTLQAALERAVSGDELWLKEGTHFPAATEDPEARFDLRSGLSLYGGFAGNEVERTQRDHVAHPTILSGDYGQDDECPIEPGGVYSPEIVGVNAAVVVQSLDAIDVTLDGLTITGAGGFTAINAAHSRMVLRNLTIACNVGQFSGAALWATDCASLVIENLTCRSNRADGAESDGGAMALSHCGEVLLSQCVFESNVCLGGEGGGVFASEPMDLHVAHCRFVSNRSAAGGGLAVRGGKVRVTACRFVDNEGGDFGGGVFAVGCEPVQVDFGEFVSNRADRGGGCHLEECMEARMNRVRLVANEAGEGGGGALWALRTAPELCDLEVLANVSDEEGSGVLIEEATAGSQIVGGIFAGNGSGAITAWNTAPVSIANATVAKNMGAGGFGLAAVTGFMSDLVFTNTIVWEPDGQEVEALGGVVTDEHSNLGEFDPKFVAPVFPGPGADAEWGTGDDVFPDFRLQADSDSIDAGASVENPPAVDFSGLRRVLGAAVDQGAHEFAADPESVDTDSDGQPDLMEAIAGTAHDDPRSLFAIEFGHTTEEAVVSWVGRMGRRYSIESSADLATWMPVFTHSAIEDGAAVIWSEPPGARRFYRGRVSVIGAGL